MLRSLKISSAVAASCLLAALAVAVGASGAAAANADKNKRTVAAKHPVYYARTAGYRDHAGRPTYYNYAGSAGYRDDAGTAAYRPRFVRPVALPYLPEYGFLKNVPPNAVRMPGYTFVPGVGILGESCDLPTSSCSNEYRDVQ